MRRSIYEEVGGFDASFRRGQDYDYWLRVSRITKIHKLDSIYAVYRTNEESVTHKPNEVDYGYAVLKKSIDHWGYQCVSGELADKKMVDRHIAKICFPFAYHHFNSGDINISLDSILISLRYDPSNISYWLYGGMIYAGSLWVKVFPNKNK